jgi:biopolymer transport protein ExbB/TolQ
MREIFELLNAGGIFMYGILVTSLVAVTVTFRRIYQLWFAFRLDTGPLLSRVSQLASGGDYGQAVQLVNGKHPLHRLMHAALLRANRSEKEIRRGVETTAVTELARFRSGTATLPQLSNLATLLGLLGTIHGLIISFSGMSGADAATRQAALSKGVAVAFYNTFFGLTVATVTVVAYLIVSSKQGKEMVKLEHAVASLVDQLLSAGKSRAGVSAGGAAASAPMQSEN